ncbi:hypothetical protein NMG60_11000931 [Bertholletia excelsa]
MLSPSPISLCCALLLCLPLAIVFTSAPTTTTTRRGAVAVDPIPVTATSKIRLTPTTVAALSGDGASTNTTTINTFVSTDSNTTRANPKSTFDPISNRTHENIRNKTTTSPNPLPPSAAVDYVADDMLLRRAARTKLHAPPPKKLAFMFLTTTPLHFAPLWEQFFNQTPKRLYNIYIHADPSFTYDPPFRGVFMNRVIPDSKPTRRFSPTLISAARRLLAHALLDDSSNYMFALLSPSCIPLHSFYFTYKTLTRSRKSFIEILRNEDGAWDRWAARGDDAMLPDLPFEDFRIGSQFFVLTRKHARMVVGDRRLWAKFKLPCLGEGTCYPEEHYFPTLLSRRDPRGCVPATLTHVDWRGRYDGHPRTYEGSDVGRELILSLRSSRPRYGDEGINGSDSSVIKRRDPFLFARKFSPDSVEQLLNIASDVIFKD